MLIFLMQEISNSSGFLGTLFHTFFMLFMRVEKITDFRFPARLIDAVTCTEILCLRTQHFNCGAVPTARAIQVELCVLFIRFDSFVFLFFSENASNLSAHRKNVVICQVFFDRGCLRKWYVALTCKNSNLQNEKDPKIGIHALTERGRVRGRLDR